MLTITLDVHSPLPMYEQIYRYIKEEIKNGSLPYHYKLPSTRNLAVNLMVSRNTVDMAYAQLVSEGYIESVPKSGYFVSMVSDLTHISNQTVPAIKLPKKVTKPYSYDFSPFAIDISSFPFNVWRKLSKNCMNEYNHDLFLLGDNQGDENLRLAITRYLHESRGVNCTPEQILVGAGADYLLQLLSQLLPLTTGGSNNTPKVKIGMENPTYKQAYKIFSGMGYEVTPIGLDQNGIHMNDLDESGSDIVYVTPSHQYPLGIVMPIKRRTELLKWADASPNRYIIEDDHDSEFRYKGKPIPALQGIDSLGKVIYVGTFSRAVAPAIRIGYMVLPKNLLDIYKKNLYYYSSTVSRVDQNIMTHFITDGYFERHLNKMRKLYKGKHDLIIHSLKIFKDKISIEGENAGLHLVLRFKTNVTEQAIIQKALDSGIRLYGLSEHYINRAASDMNGYENNPAILLGYANIPEDKIKPGIHALYQSLIDFI